LDPAAEPPASGTRETDGANADVAAEFVSVGGLTTTKEVLVLSAAAEEEVESVDLLGVRARLGVDLLDSLDCSWDDDDGGEGVVEEVERKEGGGLDVVFVVFPPTVVGAALEVVFVVFTPTVVGAALEVGVEDLSGGRTCASPPRSIDIAKPALAGRNPLLFSKLLTSIFSPAEGMPLSPFPVTSW